MEFRSECHFDNLCEEEVVEILQRLPLKLVTRCKSVSKRWFSLISGKFFAQSYVRFQTDNNLSAPRLVLIQIDLGIILPHPPPPPSPNDVKLSLHIPAVSKTREPVEFEYLCASKGLVLCSPVGCPKDYYFVSNPMTKQWIALPPLPKVVSEHCTRTGFICNDPLVHSENNNDDGSNQYKRRLSISFRVVRVRPIESPYIDLKFDIFSSETGTWTEWSFSPLPKRSQSYDYAHDNVAVACNGKLHWRRLWFETEIFSLDPYDPDHYQRLSLPIDSKVRRCIYCFGMCHCCGKQEHLKYTECFQGLIQVWELEDCKKGEWSLMYRVHMNEMVSRVPGISWPPPSLLFSDLPTVIAFHPSDGDVMLSREDCRILQYNMHTRTVEVFFLEDNGQELKANFFMRHRFSLFELPCWPTPVC